MDRLRGRKKPSWPPPPGLADASSVVGELMGSVDAKITQLHQELNGYCTKLKTSRHPGSKKHLRKRAVEVLKRKRLHEAQRDQLAGLQFTIEKAALGVESAEAVAATVAAMKAADRRLKATVNNNPDVDLDGLVDDTEDLMDELIGEVLAQDLQAPRYVDEAELEAELDALEDELESGRHREADAVPSHPRENGAAESALGAKAAEGLSPHAEQSPALSQLAHSIDQMTNCAVMIQKQWRRHRSRRRGPRGRGTVARIVRALNAVPSRPIFPRSEAEAARRNANSTRAAIVPDARAGEGGCSPDELRRVKEERSRAAGASTRKEPERSSRSGKKKARASGRKGKGPLRSGRRRSPLRKRKRKKTTEEKMRDLSVECVGLLNRMRSVPRFSPEWMLSRMEIKLISEELEHLYARMMAKRVQVE